MTPIQTRIGIFLILEHWKQEAIILVQINAVTLFHRDLNSFLGYIYYVKCTGRSEKPL